MIYKPKHLKRKFNQKTEKLFRNNGGKPPAQDPLQLYEIDYL